MQGSEDGSVAHPTMLRRPLRLGVSRERAWRQRWSTARYAVTEPGATSMAVVGAGPAGLLFAAVGKILHARAGDAAGPWELRLYDKRESYVRTHRLRIAPAPYEAIAADLSDPRIDALLSFLRDEQFRPEVNRLEERLGALVKDLGVDKETYEVDGVPSLEALVERHRPHGRVTIVGADSVHSAVRSATASGATGSRHVHQYVARLRIVGPGLPAALDPVAQVRLSKVIGSLIDYRLNANGFAEVDLFLEPTDHAPLLPTAQPARASGSLAGASIACTVGSVPPSTPRKSIATLASGAPTITSSSPSRSTSPAAASRSRRRAPRLREERRAPRATLRPQGRARPEHDALRLRADALRGDRRAVRVTPTTPRRCRRSRPWWGSPREG